MQTRNIALVFLISFFSTISFVYAETDSNEINKLKEEIRLLKSQFQEIQLKYESKINQLESKVGQLTESKAIVQDQAVPVVQPPQKNLGRYFQNFNPEISVIGDFIYHYTDKKDDEGYNQFKFRQLELAFSGSVDPYARGDIFLHVEPDDGWKVGLCEAYLTLLDLPISGLQAKLGKFKANFGKVNRLHLHSLPWSDYPNMLTNYFGEEGMSEPGISLNYLVPNPWNHYAELTFEVINNHNAESFAGSTGRNVVLLTHLKNFFDIDEESTIDFGTSFATGPNDSGHSNRTFLEGIDFTYKWRPLKQGLYKSLTFQNEFLWSQKENVIREEDGFPKTVGSWGMYSSLQYQFAKRWSVFSRYDFSGFPNYANHNDNAVSTGMTFAQSEYCFWRIHYKHTNRNYSKNSNEVWLQLDFGLGPHRKHEY